MQMRSILAIFLEFPNHGLLLYKSSLLPLHGASACLLLRVWWSVTGTVDGIEKRLPLIAPSQAESFPIRAAGE